MSKKYEIEHRNTGKGYGDFTVVCDGKEITPKALSLEANNRDLTVRAIEEHFMVGGSSIVLRGYEDCDVGVMHDIEISASGCEPVSLAHDIVVKVDGLALHGVTSIWWGAEGDDYLLRLWATEKSTGAAREFVFIRRNFAKR